MKERVGQKPAGYGSLLSFYREAVNAESGGMKLSEHGSGVAHRTGNSLRYLGNGDKRRMPGVNGTRNRIFSARLRRVPPVIAVRYESTW